MTRADRIAIWNELAQANLPLEDVVDRALARAEAIGRREGMGRWSNLEPAEVAKVEEMGRR